MPLDAPSLLIGIAIGAALPLLGGYLALRAVLWMMGHGDDDDGGDEEPEPATPDDGPSLAGFPVFYYDVPEVVGPVISPN